MPIIDLKKLNETRKNKQSDISIVLFLLVVAALFGFFCQRRYKLFLWHYAVNIRTVFYSNTTL